MHRHSLPLVSLLLVAGCASAPSNELLVGTSLEPASGTWAVEEQDLAAVPAYEVASLPEAPRVDYATPLALAPNPLAMRQEDVHYDHPHNVHHDGVQSDAYYDHPHSVHHEGATTEDDHDAGVDESLRGSRFTIKGGYYSLDSADELDDGWIAMLSWMQFFSKLFAFELEVGYFDADGEEGVVEADTWGIPLFVNGRINLPLWIFDLYGGVGIGTVYFDTEAEGGAISLEDDGFLLAGDGFIGASLNLRDSVALGLEGKYIVTDDMDEFDEGLDAFAVMLTLGFSR